MQIANDVVEDTKNMTATAVQSTDRSNPTPPILPARAPRTHVRVGRSEQGWRRGQVGVLGVDVFRQRRVPLGLLLSLDLLGSIVVSLVGFWQRVARVKDVQTEGGGDAHSAMVVSKVVFGVNKGSRY